MTSSKGAVVVTGATSDIGAAIALSLLRAGYTPVLVGRDGEKLTTLAERLEISCRYCFVINNADYEDIKVKFKSLVSTVGKLSGMVVCSGSHEIRPLKSQTHESLAHAFQQNILSALSLAQCFSSKLNSENGASLVFISSTAALLGEVGLSAYSAAKGGLISAAKALAVELAPRGLRVNCVSPGWVETSHAERVRKSIGEVSFSEIMQLYPLGLGKPIDVANIVEFLIGEKSKWITGQNFTVDGGRTLL